MITMLKQDKEIWENPERKLRNGFCKNVGLYRHLVVNSEKGALKHTVRAVEQGWGDPAEETNNA